MVKVGIIHKNGRKNRLKCKTEIFDKSLFTSSGMEDSSVNNEDSMEESVVKDEELTDLELLAASDDGGDHQIDEISNNKKSPIIGQPDCEDISSDEEDWN